MLYALAGEDAGSEETAEAEVEVEGNSKVAPIYVNCVCVFFLSLAAAFVIWMLIGDWIDSTTDSFNVETRCKFTLYEGLVQVKLVDTGTFEFDKTFSTSTFFSDVCVVNGTRVLSQPDCNDMDTAFTTTFALLCTCAVCIFLLLVLFVLVAATTRITKVFVLYIFAVSSTAVLSILLIAFKPPGYLNLFPESSFASFVSSSSTLIWFAVGTFVSLCLCSMGLIMKLFSARRRRQRPRIHKDEFEKELLRPIYKDDEALELATQHREAIRAFFMRKMIFVLAETTVTSIALTFISAAITGTEAHFPVKSISIIAGLVAFVVVIYYFPYFFYNCCGYNCAGDRLFALLIIVCSWCTLSSSLSPLLIMFSFQQSILDCVLLETPLKRLDVTFYLTIAYSIIKMILGFRTHLQVYRITFYDFSAASVEDVQRYLSTKHNMHGIIVKIKHCLCYRPKAMDSLGSPLIDPDSMQRATRQSINPSIDESAGQPINQQLSVAEPDTPAGTTKKYVLSSCCQSTPSRCVSAIECFPPQVYKQWQTFPVMTQDLGDSPTLSKARRAAACRIKFSYAFAMAICILSYLSCFAGLGFNMYMLFSLYESVRETGSCEVN